MKTQSTISSMKSTSSEAVLELLRVISKPRFKREDREAEFVLPWLCKRSQLLSRLDKSVLVDIVKNCAHVSTYQDDVIIRQGERGDSYFDDFSFYIILRGSVSVYIDSKLTGEGSEDIMERRSAANKKRAKKPPKAPESEESVLSGMEHGSVNSGELPEVSQAGGVEGREKGATGAEEQEEEASTLLKQPIKLLAPIDRNKFGKFIVKYGQGGSFGEVALVDSASFRNATVVTDEDTDLMVIDQELFDRSLKAEQEAKYAEIREFIDGHPFFKDMSSKLKKLMEMSIRKERYIFDTNIIRQGDPVVGLHFIISGSADISIQPKKHQSQYPHLWPFEAGVDQIAIEFEHLREARRAAIMRKYEDPSVWETKSEELVIRREQGYAAIEKHMKESHISLCSVQTREVLGDIESLMNLGTYIQTVRCTSDTHCFVLDTKNFERLVSNRKANPTTMDVMREYVKSKLATRMRMKQADLIPFLGYLFQKLNEQMLPQAKKVEPFKMSKSIPGADEEVAHLLQYFREGQDVMLLKPIVPGVVYYKELMHEKAKLRAQQKIASGKAGDSIKLGSVYRTRVNRKPRSIAQIRESLQQMMEAEVIEMETKKFRKKKPKRKKSPKSPKSDRHHIFNVQETPRTLIGSEKEKQDNGKPRLMGLMEALRKSEKSDAQEPNSPGSDLPPQLMEFKGAAVGSVDASDAENQSEARGRQVPPVFITEASKAEIQLPAIREEKTQEEIILRGGSPTKTPSALDTSRSRFEKPATPKTHRTDASKSPRPHSIKDKTSRKGSGKGNKRSKSLSSTPTPKPDAYNTESSPNAQNEYSKDAVPTLPLLTGSQTSLNQEGVTARTDDTTGSSNKSQGWQTALRFVNERVQDRLTKSLFEEKSAYKDYETSEGSLKLLENRIQAFHIKYGMGQRTKNLPPLKRYKLDSEVDPKPGGRVKVIRQACRFSNAEYLVKDHSHIRHKMVDGGLEFNQAYSHRKESLASVGTR
ncbi:uncharacterized protein LOC128236936 isoform X3 [Mya arenaria]|uniref:uncharacterized protein LOC128236936 isoform X3 n=1 Tax=Mya arenaria TaxID=6604 RepID=UPI0022E00CEE|nr:uncharacterized protein LOC128236936 isoform X3 [Mya arenaria]